jgi:hypothetical protein
MLSTVTRETYLKVWIFVLLTLGLLRLLTSSLSPRSSVPSTNVQPTTTTLPDSDLGVSTSGISRDNPRAKSDGVHPVKSRNATPHAAETSVSKSPQNPFGEIGNEVPVQGANLSQPLSATPPDNRVIGSVQPDSSPGEAHRSYFTLNSSKDEVLAVQGTPTEVGNYQWTYGLSTVQFRNDRVVSWTIYATNPLHARLLPSSTVSSSLDYFKIGSTKDEVLAVQGTPTEVGNYQWAYGLSTIQFRDGRVASWTIYATNPLRARKLQ